MKLFTLCLAALILSFNPTANAQLPYPDLNITVNNSGSSGYYYFCPYKLSLFSSLPPGSQTQMVLDKDGRVVYFKPVAHYFAGDFKQLPNNLVSSIYGEKFIFSDSTFANVDTVTTKNNIIFDLHDIELLPNGHYLLMGTENIQMDLSSYHMFNHVGDPGGVNAIVNAGVIQELDAARNVVFEWHSIDYFDFDDVDEFFLTDTGGVDWTHMNSASLDTDGNILISSRHFNEITKISRTDSSVIWRLGGKRNQFTFLNDTLQFVRQHDARRLPNGNLTLFDNGKAGPPIHPAFAKEYLLDEINMTADLVWYHYEGPDIFSRSQGNTQRLANGNTLISWGDLRNKSAVFSVVDPLNNTVFEVSSPDSLVTYRTFNFDSVPWLHNRPNVTCWSDSSGHFLVADSGHSYYLWSNGDTTQSIALTTNDTFFVFTPIGDGGFIGSESFIVTDSLDPCGFVGVNEIGDFRLTIYPNPATNEIRIRHFGDLRNYDVSIYDVTGRIMDFIANTNQVAEIILDISKLNSGIYFVRAGKYSGTFLKQ